MKAIVTNESSAPQGIWTAKGLKFVRPGSSLTVEAEDADLERVSRLDGISFEEATDTPSPPEPPADTSGAGGDPSNDEVVEERNGFKLVSVGGGHWHIVVPDQDEPVKARGEEAARAKFNELAGPAAE
ncbi:MAG: hypothetical protein KDA43_15175 [Hyphomonas sp.]|nr:hypothetical protein [Hyphomonas sp.]